jgi:hypothetical protein
MLRSTRNDEGPLSFVTAIAPALCIALIALLGGMATPGYSQISQFISELGATHSTYEYPVRFLGFLPAGITLLAFCWFAHGALPRSHLTTFAIAALAIYALGYVAAALFPCDLGCRPQRPTTSQIIHNIVGGFGYLIAPAFLLAFALRSRSWPASAALPVLAYIAAAISLLGLLSLSPTSSHVGISQRAVEASVLSWVIACGWYIRTRLRVAA